MKVTIRPFEKKDIPKKVEWINNPANNRYLHYDIPLCVEKTERWFANIHNRKDRFDAVIDVDEIPVGTIGLLSIDFKNRKAEYYIAMGEVAYKGKGVAKKASALIIDYGFNNLGLHRIYLYTEVGNTDAQRLFEKVGFVKEGILKDDILSHGEFADRIIYGITKRESINDTNTEHRQYFRE